MRNWIDVPNIPLGECTLLWQIIVKHWHKTKIVIEIKLWCFKSPNFETEFQRFLIILITFSYNFAQKQMPTFWPRFIHASDRCFYPKYFWIALMGICCYINICLKENSTVFFQYFTMFLPQLRRINIVQTYLFSMHTLNLCTAPHKCVSI